MPAPLPPLRLTGAQVLRDGALQRRSLAFAAGRLTRGPLPEVDLSGFLILPGIVDAHCPLPCADADPSEMLTAAAAGGVTTGVLALDWGWTAGPRAAARAEAAMIRLSRLRTRLAADSRLHLRAEETAVRDEERLLAAARAGLLHGVIFADTAGEDVPDTPELRECLRLARLNRREVPRHLCRLAEAFDDLALPYGSLADADGETRERHSMIGARIAVFPATRRAAAAAHAMMSPVILSAPALLSGDPVVTGLLAEGICDALASDGRPETLAAAAFLLAPRIGWPRAWALVSAGPAEILRLPDRGNISAGARADLVVVDPETGEVQATICAGRLTHLSGRAEARFRAQSLAIPVLEARARPVAAE
ncbi:MAG: amidohydrolase family protein [Paracoccaceae bacterium]